MFFLIFDSYFECEILVIEDCLKFGGRRCGLIYYIVYDVVY